MPFTLSHPAAVVPLARLCRSPYAYSALVIGSMVPDFEYFFRLRPTAVVGHSLLGLFVFCLPVGLFALWLFHGFVKRPTLALLPNPLRARVAAAVAPSAVVSRRESAILGALVLVGAVTHIAWDSFTHAGRGVVAHVPALSATVLQVGGVDIGIYKVLQHGSTVVGLAVLVFMAVRAIRRLEPSTVAIIELPTRVRRGVVILLASAVLTGAVLGGMAGRGDGEIVRQVQLGGARAAVVALAVLAAGVLVYGIVFTLVDRRNTRRGV